MTIATDKIDPTGSIKTIRKNILWLSLASLSCTKIIVDLHSTGNSLIAPPFNYLPLESVFTFWLSFLFIHHQHATISILLGSLFFLSLRSIFDFILYEKNSEKFYAPQRYAYTYLHQLYESFCSNLDLEPLKQSIFHRFTYLDNILPKQEKTLSSLLTDITNHYDSNSELTRLCQTLASTYSNELDSNENIPREAVNELAEQLFIEELVARKKASMELHQVWIHTLSGYLFPSFGLGIIAYCAYQLLTL